MKHGFANFVVAKVSQLTVIMEIFLFTIPSWKVTHAKLADSGKKLNH